ncbi:spermidine synthase family protein [Lipingzhangella rawalii]|nr:spermidine synthase [Lipingzhangella rawalii]
MGVCGELVLREVDGQYEIIADGMFLMDTRDGRSERAMVSAGLRALPRGRVGVRVLVGGLGVGFTARAALDEPSVDHVHVLELEPRVIAWHQGPLAAGAGHLLAEDRCLIECADLVAWLDAAGSVPETAGYDLVCLDVDNGPDWTLRTANAWLYGDDALERLRAVTRPGGVVAFWSSAPAPGFVRWLTQRCSPHGGTVETVTVPTDRGEPDTVYVARLGG